MTKEEILARVDHTLLKQTATWEEIRTLADEAIAYHTASVCIPPCYVARAAEYIQGRTAVCTVIGFPNGNTTTGSKTAEAREAVADGADELDMVINLGMVKERAWDCVLEEIDCVRQACPDQILKVIIETCLLTREEKVEMCRVVNRSGADFIKTSTGFSTDGATFEDVELLRKYSDPRVRVKAAGGISSVKDAETFLALGADRLGTSRLIRLLG
ncbi:MAG TPA: deoxyribose-phosphate aldolase [Candidatus Pullilachnospira intestinigallinarum]|nr:deoxyribose-phosphate aldolase [Candidatus Pullilachnospira intestinigallinarum]